MDELGRPWALIGAMAIAARAEARATLDVDVVVAVDGPDDAEAVVSDLVDLGYRWQRDFGTAMSSFVVPDLPPPGLRLDVLFALTGIESDVAHRAQRIEVIPGSRLPVAVLGDLIALKLLGAGEPGREHDWRDLRALVAVSGAADLDRARASVELIGKRGQGNPVELMAKLERLLADHVSDERQ